MVAKKAVIQQGGIFKKGTVMITNILKNGEEGETKSYTIIGKAKIREFNGKHIIDFAYVSGGSMGATSKGTVSGRMYTRKMNVTVDEYDIIE